MLRSALLWASRSGVLRDRLMRQRFVQRAVRRFMPGEEAADALAACEELRGAGIGAVLTELGENVARASDVQRVVSDYDELLGEIERRGLDAEISVKPTHLGLDLDPELAHQALVRLAARSAGLGRGLWVDMEGSVYTEPREMLTSVFGAVMLTEILAKARADLTERVRLLLDEELVRFVEVIDAAGDCDDVAAIRLYQAEFSLEAVR